MTWWCQYANLFPTENQNKNAIYKTEMTSPFNVVESLDAEGLCPPKAFY